ncbi:MAG: DNA repair protein [Crenarchaeota archaeon]|nr:MAG: DNA repair protein [Thermoproteota archaeon]RDJ33521.1 MAG: DNA repair protein [Thermoproteota archaeon]RDJ38159.1 MAG: DNA repair protein [Thermoproteota archaeon]RDJ39073.1 MAG: DNA repair protein [Thermoproteota archaeon]
MTSKNIINLDSTINSGQVFLWKKEGGFWYGIDGDKVLCIDSTDLKMKSSGGKVDYFRESDDIGKILKSLKKDEVVKTAISQNQGLRLLRQDPFQCYISFIVSSNSNIQNIKSTLNKLCKKFGERIEFDKKEFFLFPTSASLAEASKVELLECGLGYRADFVKKAAKEADNGIMDLGLLKKMSYVDAKNELLRIFGIGNKVADCIMLFSLEKLEAFPLDTWMLKILRKYYTDLFPIEGKSITEKKYNLLHEKVVSHFGPYAGYSQQFLFKMERDAFHKKWL